MSLGPVMVDIAGTQISAEEYDLLRAPAVGGVILFTRNFVSIAQVSGLIDEIHALRSPHLLIAIDHEGGRVQRFHEGFTRLPPAAVFGEIFSKDEPRARQLAEQTGWLMASELRAIGVDFSFAPVLDLAHGVSGIIGNRAFHHNPATAATLAYAFMHGMQQAGMAAVGKHFPGHGGVAEDSHLALPVDRRDFATLMQQDIVPFAHMIHNGLPAVMPAHVIYEKVDAKPAGYSALWLQTILRQQLNFQGVIFSDDLTMEAACVAGGYAQRADQALAAGCDMVLVCNHTQGALEVAAHLQDYANPVSQLRLTRMHGKHAVPRDKLLASDRWRKTSQQVAKLDQSPWLEMDV
jgi:beta-N-acetylhexosaminidase